MISIQIQHKCIGFLSVILNRYSVSIIKKSNEIIGISVFPMIEQLLHKDLAGDQRLTESLENPDMSRKSAGQEKILNTQSRARTNIFVGCMLQIRLNIGLPFSRRLRPKRVFGNRLFV